MKSREEIMNESCDFKGDTANINTQLILGVLLDIRELLEDLSNRYC